MRKNWIHSFWYDIVFFISPPFGILLFLFLLPNKIESWQENNATLSWLLLIVFIDVAHVYATLFKTYFNPIERKYYRGYLIKIPIISFLIGLLLYSFGTLTFWSVLAYIAVFHFIRQQYGFVKLYTREDKATTRWLDNLVLYTVTLYPMLFWFFSPKRNFNWFVENEFWIFPNHTILTYLKIFYFLIIGWYLLYEVRSLYKTKTINLPKNLWLFGTALSWYFGIVYFNSDIVFTLLNVVCHGIPYMALVYANQRKEKHIAIIPKLTVTKGIFVFLFIILLIAILEESLWDILVWKEHFAGFIPVNLHPKWEILLVPLLTVPQFSHYLLDGIIWKRKKSI